MFPGLEYREAFDICNLFEKMELSDDTHHEEAKEPREDETGLGIDEFFVGPAQN